MDVLQHSIDPYVTSYVENLFLNGLLQLVTKPTRVSNTSATCIDHILSNKVYPVYNTYIVTSKLSDHFPIFYVRESASKRSPPPPTVDSRNFSTQNIQKFKNNVSGLHWGEVTSSNNTQTSYDSFLGVLIGLYDIHFPLVQKKFNKNIHPFGGWMSRGLLISRLNKIKLGNQSLKNPSVENLAKFKTYCNLYNKTLRASKKNFFSRELALNHSNLKKTWSLLNQALNRKSKSNNINSLKLGNIETTDPLEMAEGFNSFFTTIAEKIAEEIPPPLSPWILIRIRTVLFLIWHLPQFLTSKFKMHLMIFKVKKVLTWMVFLCFLLSKFLMYYLNH